MTLHMYTAASEVNERFLLLLVEGYLKYSFHPLLRFSADPRHICWRLMEWAYRIFTVWPLAKFISQNATQAVRWGHCPHDLCISQRLSASLKMTGWSLRTRVHVVRECVKLHASQACHKRVRMNVREGNMYSSRNCWSVQVSPIIGLFA